MPITIKKTNSPVVLTSTVICRLTDGMPHESVAPNCAPTPASAVPQEPATHRI